MYICSYYEVQVKKLVYLHDFRLITKHLLLQLIKKRQAQEFINTYMRGKSVGFHGWNSSPGPEKWSPTNFRPCASEIGLERLLKADKTSSEIEGHKSLYFGCWKFFFNMKQNELFVSLPGDCLRLISTKVLESLNSLIRCIISRRSP